MTDEAGLLREVWAYIIEHHRQHNAWSFPPERCLECRPLTDLYAALAVAQVPAPAKCDELWECGGGKHEPGCVADPDDVLPRQGNSLWRGRDATKGKSLWRGK